jgi:hypothetical protein
VRELRKNAEDAAFLAPHFSELRHESGVTTALSFDEVAALVSQRLPFVSRPRPFKRPRSLCGETPNFAMRKLVSKFVIKVAAEWPAILIMRRSP